MLVSSDVQIVKELLVADIQVPPTTTESVGTDTAPASINTDTPEEIEPLQQLSIGIQTSIAQRNVRTQVKPNTKTKGENLHTCMHASILASLQSA